MSDDQLSLVPGKKKRVKAEVPIAKIAPVAHIVIDSPLPHLDRVFDYAVPEKLSRSHSLEFESAFGSLENLPMAG